MSIRAIIFICLLPCTVIGNVNSMATLTSKMSMLPQTYADSIYMVGTSVSGVFIKKVWKGYYF